MRTQGFEEGETRRVQSMEDRIYPVKQDYTWSAR